MFETGSRYYTLGQATYTTEDGREITYVRRRFCPQAEKLATLVEVTVTDGERLDLLAARTIGNAEQFWRICDAENSLNPAELIEKPGRVLKVPIPEVN